MVEQVCELCDMEISGEDYVTHNNHKICYDCVDEIESIKLSQEEKDGE